MKNIHNFRLDKNSILILPHISTYKGNICYRIKTSSIVKRKTLNYSSTSANEK
jgi:hypothetical protein